MPRALIELDERPRPTLRIEPGLGLAAEPAWDGLIHRVVGYLQERVKGTRVKVGFDLREGRIWFELPTGHRDEAKNMIALLEQVAERLNRDA